MGRQNTCHRKFRTVHMYRCVWRKMFGEYLSCRRISCLGQTHMQSDPESTMPILFGEKVPEIYWIRRSNRDHFIRLHGAAHRCDELFGRFKDVQSTAAIRPLVRNEGANAESLRSSIMDILREQHKMVWEVFAVSDFHRLGEPAQFFGAENLSGIPVDQLAFEDAQYAETRPDGSEYTCLALNTPADIAAGLRGRGVRRFWCADTELDRGDLVEATKRTQLLKYLPDSKHAISISPFPQGALIAPSAKFLSAKPTYCWALLNPDPKLIQVVPTVVA